MPTGYREEIPMTAWALLSDRTVDRVLPALGDLRLDLKHEPLSVVPLGHVLELEPSAVLVDAVENPGQAWSVLKELRARNDRVATVLIVERDRLDTFPWEELVDEFVFPGAPAAEIRLRLDLLRRRSGGRDGAVVHLGQVAIDTETYRVTAGGRALDLTFKEFELLRYLALHPGRVSTRPALLREVWGYDFYGGTRTVDVHVRRLRAKLGPEHEHLIETVRGVGYRASDDA
jgi:DNA-binding response OmpR family regulator